jgi:hypothetical protein
MCWLRASFLAALTTTVAGFVPPPFVPITGPDGQGYGLRVGEWSTHTPIEIEVVWADQQSPATWIRTTYVRVNQVKQRDAPTPIVFVAEAVVSVGSGSASWRLEVTDIYTTATVHEIVFNRTIVVVAVHRSTPTTPHPPTTNPTTTPMRHLQYPTPEGGDELLAAAPLGFSSRFALGVDTPTGLDAPREFFMPGVWYLRSQPVTPPGALAGDLNASHVLIREDRLPLPLVRSSVFNRILHSRLLLDDLDHTPARFKRACV